MEENKGYNVLSLFDGMSCGRIALERSEIKVANYFSSEIKGYAIKVANENYPQDAENRLGDITKIDGTKLPKIDLLIGGSPCFTAGTKIITKNANKNIEDVKIGDLVLTHTNTYKEVLRIGGKENAQIVNVKIKGLNLIETTPEHPFYVIEKKGKTFSEPKWVEAKYLTKKHYSGFNILQDCINHFDLTEEECYIIGRYIADGHTRKDLKESGGRKYQLILSLGNTKLSHVENVKNIHYSLYEHSKSIHRWVFSNKRLVEIVESECGCGAKNKFISKKLLDLPVNLLSILLQGYLDGDGSIKNDKIRATSISDQLMYSLGIIVAKVHKTGFNNTYSIRPPKYIIEGRLVNQNNTQTFSFFNGGDHKQHFVLNDGIIWQPIRKVEITNKYSTVYNIEVKDDNSYTANGAIVHNCQDFSGANKERLGTEGVKSGLFFEYVRLLEETKPTYFFLENVRMKKEHQDFISSVVGCEPIVINSELVAPHLRHRLYWTNIPFEKMPDDKGLQLNDFLIDGYTDRAKARTLLESDSRPLSTPIKMAHRYFNTGFTTLIFKSKKHYDDLKEHFDRNFKGRSAKEIDEIAPFSDLSIYNDVRYMNNREREACQTVPAGYTDSLSRDEAACILGDGWTVDVIAHLFKGLPKK